jgi:hypothetical protein
MTPEELSLLRTQLKVLRSVAVDYSGRTIENIITNIESRIKHYDGTREKTNV